MVYETPTTKEQMYEILKQIYYDYRMKIDGYEDAGLTDLILDRMEFTEKTDEELFEEARGLTIPWYDAELLKAKKTNEAKILALSKSLLSLDNEKLGSSVYKERLTKHLNLHKSAIEARDLVKNAIAK